jgi:hypothetical protein
MKHVQLFLFWSLVICLAAFLVSCGSSDSATSSGGDDNSVSDDDAPAGDDDEAAGDDNSPGDDDSPDGDDDDADDDGPMDDDDVPTDPEPAQFTLFLIDAPVDEAESVNITINKISVHLSAATHGDDDDDDDDDDDNDDDDAAASDDDDAVDDDDDDDDGELGDGEWVDLEIEPTRYDLLELQNNISALLADQELPLGDYTEIRLMIDCTEGNEPSIVIDGEESFMKVPSGCQSGIKMPHHFTLNEGDTINFVMDFDVRKSVHQTGNGKYIMQPVVRLVDLATSGTISGQVLPAGIDAVVYAFEAGTYDPQAQDPFENAFNSAMPDEEGNFVLAALPTGNYDLVVTADGYLTDASQANVAVVAGEDAAIGQITMVAEI